MIALMTNATCADGGHTSGIALVVVAFRAILLE